MRRKGGEGSRGGFTPTTLLSQQLTQIFQLSIILKRVCKHFFSSNEGYMNKDSTIQIFKRVLFYLIVFEVKNQLTNVCPVTKLL